MQERQDYLRRLHALVAVVLPEHRQLVGELTTVRTRAILKAFPTARHLAQATPDLRVAQAAGVRGFSLEDADQLHQAAVESIYSSKAWQARGQVVRTLLTQIERLNASVEELDQAMQALLPPPDTGQGPSDAQLLQSIPGIGPQTAAVLVGELGELRHFHSAKALVAYVGFYPKIDLS